MSEIAFNVNNSWRPLAQAYVHVHGSWREAEEYVNVNGTWKLVSLKRVTATGGPHFDLFASLLPHVGGASNVEITLTGTFYATSTSYAALSLNTSFAGKKVKIINNALIQGANGSGGAGGYDDNNGYGGGAGGTALYVHPSHGCKRLEFYNTSGARIYAGGGGGGGGGGARKKGYVDNRYVTVRAHGGAGGNGAGYSGGATAGAPGKTAILDRHTATGGDGGAGGAIGRTGAKGVSKSGAGGAGGTAGIAIHNVGSIILSGYTDTGRIIGRRI